MKVERISISICKLWEMSKGDDRMKESDSCSNVQNYTDGMLPIESDPHKLYCSVAAHDLNIQNGKCLHKTKHSFLSTYIRLVLLENSVHKKFFLLSVKLSQALCSETYKQGPHLW